MLIYSASTSLGLFTLELARLLRTPSGNSYTIIVTASPKHHEKLKSLGADAVYDYNDSEWADKAKKEWPQGIDYAVDCISEGPTTGIISQLFNTRPHAEKIIAVIRAVAWDKASVRSDVKALYGAVWEGLGHEIVYNGSSCIYVSHLTSLLQCTQCRQINVSATTPPRTDCRVLPMAFRW